MKKFWNLMLAALVIIGAAACTENYENIEKVEGFSFYANFADTRATIEKDGESWKTVWELGDKLYVNGTYEFVCTDVETGKFTCYDNTVAELAGQNVTITTDGKHHSLEGKSAFYTTANVENFGAGKVELQALTSFFRFTYNGEVKFTLSEPLFRTEDGTATNEIAVSGTGEQFVAFWPQGDNATLTYYVNNVECNSASKAFAAGMVYNLGELKSIYELSTCTVNGAHNNWTAETATPMYIVGDYQVAYNVAVTEFKLLTTAGDWLGVASSNIALSTWVPASTSGSNIKVSAGNYDIYYSIDRQLICVVTAGAEVPSLPELPQTRKIYLNTGGSGLWDQSGAWFEAWVWGGSTADAWYKFVAVSGKAGYYYIEVPKDRTGMKILRRGPSHNANSWDDKWNNTGNVTIPADQDLLTITGWGENDWSWSTYSK